MVTIRRIDGICFEVQFLSTAYTGGHEGDSNRALYVTVQSGALTTRLFLHCFVFYIAPDYFVASEEEAVLQYPKSTDIWRDLLRDST